MRISRSEQGLFRHHLLCQEESLANNKKPQVGQRGTVHDSENGRLFYGAAKL